VVTSPVVRDPKMTALAMSSNYKRRTIISSEIMLRRDYITSVEFKKIAGLESQGAWRQDELIGSKPLLVK
jgi:hypothetical protein